MQLSSASGMLASSSFVKKRKEGNDQESIHLSHTSHQRHQRERNITQNNWTLMETSLAESQTDSYFPTKWPNSYPKQKDVSDTHFQSRTITKINHDRRTALERSVKSISLRGGGGVGGGGLKSTLRGHNPRPYFCRGLDI